MYPAKRPSRNTGSLPHKVTVGSSQPITSETKRLRSGPPFTLSKAGLARKSRFQSTAKDKPASNGFSSTESSWPQARYAFSIRRVLMA